MDWSSPMGTAYISFVATTTAISGNNSNTNLASGIMKYNDFENIIDNKISVNNNNPKTMPQNLQEYHQNKINSTTKNSNFLKEIFEIQSLAYELGMIKDDGTIDTYSINNAISKNQINQYELYSKRI